MNPAETNQTLRLAILQRVCPSYRKPLFERLSAQASFEVHLIIGDNVPGTKVKSVDDLSGLSLERLPSSFYKIAGKTFVHHKGVVAALERFDPDVILCEGDSSLLTYLKAFWYRRKHQDVGLIQWSVGAVPGKPVNPSSLKTRCRVFLYRSFDGFYAYSSFSRKALLKMGVPADKITSTVNVCDTDHHLAANDQISLSSSEAKASLGLSDRLTLLYVGAIDPNKRLDELVRAAKLLGEDRFQAVIVGDGNALPDLKEFARSEGVTNVSFPGRINDEISSYYRAADIMVVPGRGGMVISEAMAYARPVIVYQADGTEYDLVRDGETGIRLQIGNAEELAERVRQLADTPERIREMGKAGNRLIRERFNQQNMMQDLLNAAHAAHDRRASH